MEDAVDTYLGNISTRLPFVPYQKPDQPSRDDVRWFTTNNDSWGLKGLLKRYPQAANQLAPFRISPLHESCRLGNMTMVELLLQHGARVDAR